MSAVLQPALSWAMGTIGVCGVLNNNIVVFKTPHTPLTRKLGIQRQFAKLKRDLQRTLGNSVLDDVRVVVASPVDNCVFRDTYGKNFPIDTFPS